MSNASSLKDYENICYIVGTTAAGLITLCTLYGVVVKQWLYSKKCTILMAIILIFSFLHTISTAMLHFFAITWIQYRWTNLAVAFCALFSVNAYVICQLEILYLFSPIAPYWTERKVFWMQVASVPIQVLINIPSYFQPALLLVDRTTRAMFYSWITYGAGATAGFMFLFGTWQMVYLVYKVYFSVSAVDQTKALRKVPTMIWFLSIYLVTVLIDWVGIYMYVQGRVIMDIIAFEILHIRIILLAYNFRQLLTITFTKNQLDTATKSRTKRAFLSSSKKSSDHLS